MRHRSHLVALFLEVAAMSFCASVVVAEGRFYVAGVDDDQKVYNMFHQLQKAIAANDRNAVAAMVEYPLHVGYFVHGSSKMSDAEFDTSAVQATLQLDHDSKGENADPEIQRNRPVRKLAWNHAREWRRLDR